VREDSKPPEPIKVWPFEDAPEEYRKLSEHGGDEDWLALVPARYLTLCIPWAESGGRFGISETSEHVLPNGMLVLIGAHA